MGAGVGVDVNRGLIRPPGAAFVPVAMRANWHARASERLENAGRRPHIVRRGSYRVPSRFLEIALSHPQAAASVPIITVYTSATCGYCSAAKNFLRSKGLEWTEVRIDLDPEARERMLALARRTSVPQIFIGATHVGGYDDLIALHRAGNLEPLLAGSDA
jgi:glutaredoxin 3